MSTIFEKIWKEHVIVSKDDKDLLYIDLHLIHEVTTPQAFEALKQKNRKVRRPDLTFATMDHNTPTIKEHREYIEDDLGREQLEALEKNTEEFGIELYDMDSEKNAIVHMMGPERGLTQPGKTIVCGDSHTATHGAFGAIAFGIGTSEVEQVFATQSLWQKMPKQMGVKITGELPQGVYSKDIILKLIGMKGTGFGSGYAVEFFGDTVGKLSMEARLTICNMAIEGGAKFGLIAPDSTTFEYLKGKEFAPADEEFGKAVERWKKLKTDSETDYDEVIILDVSRLKPQITWGTNPSMVMDIDGQVPKSDSEEYKNAYNYTGLKPGDTAQDIPVDVVFIGSCTNGRFEDLKIAAEYLEDKKIAAGVKCIVVPGSTEVKRKCKDMGYDRVFTEAGCEFREAGCSYCLAMNEDRIEKGKHCISTSNRNFEGRQGAGSITHLTSPYTAIKAAVEGKVRA